MKPHNMVLSEPLIQERYGRITQQQIVTCSGCQFQHHTSLTQKGSLPLDAKRLFVNHVTATQVASRQVEFAPASLIARVLLQRGEPREFWVYHVNDRTLPDTAKIFRSNQNLIDWLETKRREILTAATSSRWTFEPFAEPWMVIKSKDNKIAKDTHWATREEAIARCIERANREAQLGRKIETYEDMDAEGVQAPLASVQTYLEALVKRHRNANSTKQIHAALEEITEIKKLMATVDELEEQLNERMFGSFT